MGFIFPSTGTLSCVVWPGAGISCPQDVSLIFIHHTWMWDCVFGELLLLSHSHWLAVDTLCPLHPSSPFPPFLPVWMNIASLNPWLLDFNTVQFSCSSGCFSFWNQLSSFLWLCKEAKCICLCLHLDGKSRSNIWRLHSFNFPIEPSLEWCRKS